MVGLLQGTRHEIVCCLSVEFCDPSRLQASRCPACSYCTRAQSLRSASIPLRGLKTFAPIWPFQILRHATWTCTSHSLESLRFIGVQTPTDSSHVAVPSCTHPPRLANTELRDLVGGITTTVLGDVMALDMFRPVIEYRQYRVEPFSLAYYKFHEVTVANGFLGDSSQFAAACVVLPWRQRLPAE